MYCCVGGLVRLSSGVPLHCSCLFHLGALGVLDLVRTAPRGQIGTSLHCLGVRGRCTSAGRVGGHPCADGQRLLGTCSALTATTRAIKGSVTARCFGCFVSLGEGCPRSTTFSTRCSHCFASLGCCGSVQSFRGTTSCGSSIVCCFHRNSFRFSLARGVILALGSGVSYLSDLRECGSTCRTCGRCSMLLSSTHAQDVRGGIRSLRVGGRISRLIIRGGTLRVSLRGDQDRLCLFLTLLVLSVYFKVFVFFHLKGVGSLCGRLRRSGQLIVVTDRGTRRDRQVGGTFVGGVYRRIHAPLGTVGNFTRLVADSNVDPRRGGRFDGVVCAGYRGVASVVGSILMVTRLSDDGRILPLRPIRVNLLYRRRVGGLGGLRRGPSVRCRIRNSGDGSLVCSSPGRFNVVVSRLLDGTGGFAGRKDVALSCQPRRRKEVVYVYIASAKYKVPTSGDR